MFFLVERAGNLSPSFVIDLVTLYFTIYSIIKLFLPGFRIPIHLIRIQIQRFRLNTDPDPIRIQGFDDQKLKKIYSRASLQLSKENSQHFKT